MRGIIRTIVLILIYASLAHAQWEYGGKQIGIGPPTVDPVLAPDGHGGVFVVWAGYVYGVDSTDIILSHFDSAGVALFGEAGIAITSDTGITERRPNIAADGAGGCFVVWAGNIKDPDERGSMFGQRITYEGELLWGAGKRLLYTKGYSLERPQLLADSSFGLVALCVLDTGAFGNYDYGIFGQRTDYEGNLLWDSTGVLLFWPPGNPFYDLRIPKFCRSGNDFYCTWIYNLSLNNEDIYLQRFDVDGNIYYSQAGFAISTAPYHDGIGYEPRSLQIVPDGFGGVVIGWVYDNYSEATLKAQRINSNGQEVWDSNGIRLLPYERSHRSGVGLHRFGNRFVTVVLGGYQANFEVVDTSGNLEFGGLGDTLARDFYYASVSWRDTVFFIEHYREGDYCGSKRDTTWQEHWSSRAYIRNSMRKYDILPDGFGGIYVAFTLYRNFPTDWVYIQRIYADGYAGGDTVTGVAEDNIELPENPLALKAYPNPFNSSVIIAFDNKGGSEALIKIYDALGRLIDTVNIGPLTSGLQEYRWDPQKRGLNLASGSYLVKVTIRGIESSSDITLLK